MTQHILIVEDNVDTIEMLQKVLEQAGFVIHIAPNGAEGLRQARAARPGVILLDIMMPIMDGITMNSELKKDPTLKDIPVIVITARDGMNSLFDPKKGQGIQGYLVKPFSRATLLEQVNKVLKH